MSSGPAGGLPVSCVIGGGDQTGRMQALEPATPPIQQLLPQPRSLQWKDNTRLSNATFTKGEKEGHCELLGVVQKSGREGGDFPFVNRQSGHLTPFTEPAWHKDSGGYALGLERSTVEPLDQGSNITSSS